MLRAVITLARTTLLGSASCIPAIFSSSTGLDVEEGNFQIADVSLLTKKPSDCHLRLNENCPRLNHVSH